MVEAFSTVEAYTGRELGWKSGAFGFSVFVASLSGSGVDGFADVDLAPLVAPPPSVFVVSECVYMVSE